MVGPSLKRNATSSIATLAAFALVAVAVFVATSGNATNDRLLSRARAERVEQATATERRLNAVDQARQVDRLGQTGPLASAPPAGWAGEQLASPTDDDWEPAIAAAPTSPWVYMLTTRYTGPNACGNRCPTPFIVLRRSDDGGLTWKPDQFLCECAGQRGQFDPIIEVVPGTGSVYSVWMNDFDVFFTKSTNNGATWSAPVKTYGKVAWNDKPVLAVSDDGQHVYLAWNGPSGGDPYIAQSHDAGATWTQMKVVNSTRYYFAFDGDVLADGTVVFSQSSVSYTGPGASAEGQVQVHAIRSTNQGSTWSNIVLDSVELGSPCVASGCSEDYYLGHSAVSADATGALVMLYDGATTAGGPQTIWSRRSSDGGATWSNRTALSTTGSFASFPAMESRGAGDVRAFYMQQDGGPDAWNVWYRSSTDGGVSWSSPVKISDATGGTAYKTAIGFREPYGDYGEAAITNTGRFIGVWGEGDSYTGPGGVWINRQL
ncbi:MAG: glycoside hydrolase [Actinomycetota bacterium]|nr:glycoside hydrolase [Actinomycetota bacterium]MDH5225438.1 glycoside hydrolase [Actinomycetota bacterium]MDH5313574.1 glycoside hydrolase [Actinomycetota bacterium]